MIRMTVYAGPDGPWTDADRRNAARRARGSILQFCLENDLDPDSLEIVVKLDEERNPSLCFSILGPDFSNPDLYQATLSRMREFLFPRIHAAYPDTIFRAGDGHVRLIERIVMRKMSWHERIEALAATSPEAILDAPDT